MRDKLYRAWLKIEEIDESEGYASKLVEQIELATFQTIEEALAYRYELSQKYLPRTARKSDILIPMTSPDRFTTGD